MTFLHWFFVQSPYGGYTIALFLLSCVLIAMIVVSYEKATPKPYYLVIKENTDHSIVDCYATLNNQVLWHFSDTNAIIHLSTYAKVKNFELAEKYAKLLLSPFVNDNVNVTVVVETPEHLVNNHVNYHTHFISLSI